MNNLEKQIIYSVLVRLIESGETLTRLERRDLLNQLCMVNSRMTLDEILSVSENNRKLQIKRGTTNENDNFTGAIGEITMDTDVKTLRVHDGETVGGIALARADAEFDMSQISYDNAHQLIGNRIWISEEVSLSSSANVVINHNLNLEQPYMALAIPYLKFYDTIAGYAVGDIISQFGLATNAYTPNNQLLSSSDYGKFLNLDTNTVTIPRSQYSRIYIPNKSTGIPEVPIISTSSVKVFVKIIY